MTYATTQQFISTGTETHGFGIVDDKGREVGAKVIFGVVTHEAADGGTFDVKPGTYLTAYVHAARGGKDFCRNGGSYAQFEIRNGDEVSAMRSSMAWVAEKLAAAKDRAAKNFA